MQLEALVMMKRRANSFWLLMAVVEKRINYSSGLAWEPLRGYSRAVLVGETLYISGTTAVTESGDVIGIGDAYIQTKQVIRTARQVLRKAGFTIEEVVRTRMYVSDISKWSKYARAHREVFERVRPASSIVEVSALMDPRIMIEMEFEAVRGAQPVETELIELPEVVPDP